MEQSKPELAARPAPLRRKWQYTLEVLSPLHIGAGGEPLHEDIDFRVNDRGEVEVLDALLTMERIYDNASKSNFLPANRRSDSSQGNTNAGSGKPRPTGTMADLLAKKGLEYSAEDDDEPPPQPARTIVGGSGVEEDWATRLARGLTVAEALEAGWLSRKDFSGEGSLVRYVLRSSQASGEPFPPMEQRQILPYVTDLRMRPYVPGSSLKGAIRTVLSERLFSTRGTELQLGELRDDRGRFLKGEAADDNVERDLFGQSPRPSLDPNYDLLRALTVGDSRALDEHPVLEISGTYSIRGEALQFKPGFYVALEALPVGTQFSGQLSLDLHLFSQMAQEKLHFKHDLQWLENFPSICNEHARELIVEEAAFYRRYRLSRVAVFYDKLLEQLDGLGDRECLLQISWGTGWIAKTLGLTLAEQELFYQVRDIYSLGRPRVPVFPKTRRLRLSGKGFGEPVAPFGWVKLSLGEPV